MKVVCYKRPAKKDIFVDKMGKERWWGGPALVVGDSYVVLNDAEHGDFYILEKVSLDFWAYKKEIFMIEFDYHMKEILEEE